MPEKKRVAVLFGGHSSEYGVSLQSAASVLEEIDRELSGDMDDEDQEEEDPFSDDE